MTNKCEWCDRTDVRNTGGGIYCCQLHDVGEVFIEAQGNLWAVCFKDSSGRSTLAKTRSSEYAKKLLTRFSGYLEEGRLLPTYKSAYKK